MHSLAYSLKVKPVFFSRMSISLAICNFIGALLSLFCVIVFPESNSACSVVCLILIGISCYPLLTAIISRDLGIIFNCLGIFNLAPVWFLYLEGIIPGYDAYDFIKPADRGIAFFWISVFLMVFNLSYFFLIRYAFRFGLRIFQSIRSLTISYLDLFHATIIAFLLPLLGFYFYYNSIDTLWTAMTAGRTGGGATNGLLIQNSLGGYSSFMLPLTWLWQLTPVFGSLTCIKGLRYNKIIGILGLLFSLCVIFVYFLSGSRGMMIFVAAPPFLFFVYANWRRGIWFWMVVVSLLIAFIAVMELQVRFRGNLLRVLSDPRVYANELGYKSATTFDFRESHRDNNLYLLSLITKGYPDKYSYEGFNEFIAIILNPVPRALWNNKPILTGARGISFQKRFIRDGPLNMGTTSLSYSIIGNAIIAQGILGIVVYCVFYSFVFCSFDSLSLFQGSFNPLYLGIWSISIFLAFWSFRGFFAFISFLYPIIMLIVIVKIISFFHRE